MNTILFALSYFMEYKDKFIKFVIFKCKNIVLQGAKLFKVEMNLKRNITRL